jgi:cytoskeletal protein CcmA (bactofilin family)
MANIGKSVTIKGELSGSEDLYIDGEVQGSIDLHGHGLTVGPNGRVRANIQAKSVVIHGKVDGNVHGSDKVELKSSAVLVGDIAAKRIAIEEGGFLKGKVELTRDEANAEVATQPKPAATVASSPGPGVAVGTPAASEHKK